MAINIKFDLSGNPEPPTIILANRNGNKLGQLKVNEDSVELSDKFNDASELSFTVNKYTDGRLTPLWDKLVDFKLIYCKEWDLWLEAKVELDEKTESVKTVFCTQLGQAELSQIMLYDIEINTEEDIEREDYKISILYDENDPKSSILNRMLEKAPHYSILHVDDTIKNIQRSFSFDNTSIHDAFQEVAEEIGCFFVYHSNSGEDGKIQRTISVYDLQQKCNSCGHRGEFTDKCPKCDSMDIKYGYGEDTLIFVTADELASEGIELVTDTDSVKNCFKLEAGDDLMTATVRNCNPNGTDYIWYFSDAVKEDMTDELVDKIESYDAKYKEYYNEYESDIPDYMISKYNNLVKKYSKYNEDLQTLSSPIKGYSNLMNAYYDTIDLALYLESGLMPSIEMSDTTAQEQADLLTSSSLSPVAVNTENVEAISLTTANSAVLSMVKIIVRSTYKVEVNTSTLSDDKIWEGNFVITNYSDDEDTAISKTVKVTINNDTTTFIKQKIDKALNKEDTDNLSISGLFEKDYEIFLAELKKYALNHLKSFYDACDSCLNILIDQGAGDKNTSPDLYASLYEPYYRKSSAIASEIKVREDELIVINGFWIEDNENNKILITKGMQKYIEEHRNKIKDALDFEKYLGEDLWLEFCAYRREDTYSNDNYISDGLDNAELFKKASEFYEVAENEIYKSAELQHSISTSLNNLLAISKFKSLVNSFNVGNWIRVQIDDQIFKLRLLEYEIDFGSFDNISVEFSDVTKIKNGITDMESILSQASSMATSYGSVQRQAQQGEKGSVILSHWVEKGLDATNTKIVGGADNQTQSWDNHGMLFKKYDSINDTYEDTQLKIINSTLAITDDNWRTVKTAVGAYYYYHPETGKLTKAYGVNAETLVGKVILGEQLGIYNENGSLKFDKDGFVISSNNEDNKNSFRVDPNSDVLVAINNGTQDVFYVDSNGRLHITGDGSGLEISSNADITNLSSQLDSLSSDMDDKVSFKDLSVPNDKTIIDGSNITTGSIDANLITTGTLNANYINMSGKFSVYNGSFIGGYVGYMSGSMNGIITDGIGVSNSTGNCYAIATNAGVRLQAGDYSLYINTEGRAEITAEDLVINGNLTVKGSLTYNE